MKKLYIILIGMIFLIGIVISFTQISETFSFTKEQIDTLTLTGITNPLISSCLKIDDYKCKATIYEKGGINKQIDITTKFCEVYVFNETLNETTSECKTWKTLTQNEIETAMKETTEVLLLGIVDVQNNRNQIKEELTDEILINIEET